VAHNSLPVAIAKKLNILQVIILYVHSYNACIVLLYKVCLTTGKTAEKASLTFCSRGCEPNMYIAAQL